MSAWLLDSALSTCLISYLFQHGHFFSSWPQLFYSQGIFGWDFTSFFRNILFIFIVTSNIFLKFLLYFYKLHLLVLLIINLSILLQITNPSKRSTFNTIQWV